MPGYPTLESWFSGTPDYYTGNAVFYGPNVMRGTAFARGLSLEGYVDGVSALSCADVGLDVWLRRPGHDWEGPFLNVDCSQRNDIYGNIIVREEAVELGFRTAERWGMAQATSTGYEVISWRLEGVEVSNLRPEMLTGDPVPLIEWWADRLEFVDLHTFEKEVRNGWHRPLYQSPSSWRLRGEWLTFLQPQSIPPTATPMPVPTTMPTPATPEPALTLWTTTEEKQDQPKGEHYLMNIGEALVPLALVALLIESIVDTLKPFWDPTKRQELGDRIAALAVGEVVAVFGGFDIFAVLGVPLENFANAGPWVGFVLTGILFSRGAGFVHSLIEGAAGLASRFKAPSA